MSDQEEKTQAEQDAEETADDQRPYDPSQDPAVQKLLETDEEQARNEIEREAVEQSDNRPKETDPEQPEEG